MKLLTLSLLLPLFATACSSSDAPTPSAADAAPATTSPDDDGGALADAATPTVDASTADAAPKAGPITAMPTDPTTCTTVCEGAGLTCVDEGAQGVGMLTYHRADASICTKGILTCAEEVSPTGGCSGRLSVSVDMTCDCQ